MSSSSNEFTLYAKAERLLCDAAAPALGELLRTIEAELGVSITEVRVTVQRAEHDGKTVTANCTIVSAQTVQRQDHWSAGDRTNPATRNVGASEKAAQRRSDANT